jgi:hypothetical protein
LGIIAGVGDASSYADSTFLDNLILSDAGATSTSLFAEPPSFPHRKAVAIGHESVLFFQSYPQSSRFFWARFRDQNPPPPTALNCIARRRGKPNEAF